VNTDPYGNGWIFELSLDDVEELKALNDADEYRDLLAEGGH
jgi:glycine cleavage system H lipoate-binding protein